MSAPYDDTANDHLVFEHLAIERNGPVGWLISNRPDVGGPTDDVPGVEFANEFAAAWHALDADPAVRVIVHTGHGRNLVGDADTSASSSNGPARRADIDEVEGKLQHQHRRKPVIIAVNGICCGVGLSWVATADIAIAASDAEFFDPEVSAGGAVSIGTLALMKTIPVEAAMRMAFMGRHERVRAPRALQLGLISEIVDPPEHLRARAQQLGETIAKNSPAAMAATRKALWGALELGLTDACMAGAKHLVSMWGHPDQIEGPAAFAEKRAPRWAGP
jgi:enoyl-CoA hydratase